MTCFTIQQVRAIATRHSYHEITLNENSCVISYRGGPSNSTRINVYYSTGTVGTCLNHPSRGKTQLFRRDVKLAGLEKIFENPRMHTGRGYFRKHSSQSWKADDGSDAFESDAARRWKFVATATGLATSKYELDLISLFCSLFDNLYWEPGSLPDIHETRYGCGSRAVLIGMVLEVANDICSAPVSCCKRCEVQEYRKGKIWERDVHKCENIGSSYNVRQFSDNHEGEVQELKSLLQSMRKDVQIELIQWLVGRDWCGYTLVDANYEFLNTDLSPAVEETHREYGKLMYPRKARLCLVHGVAIPRMCQSCK